MVDDSDKKFVEEMLSKMNSKEHSWGDFVIRNKRECKQCRKGADLNGFTDLKDFGINA